MNFKSDPAYIKDCERRQTKQLNCPHNDEDFLLLKCKTCGKMRSGDFEAIEIPAHIRDLLEEHFRTIAS